MTTSVLVPYRPDRGHRDRAWAWNRRRWEALGVELIVESPGPGEDAADFNHPLAINRAAERATGDVFIVADADTTFARAEWVDGAVRAVRDGSSWILPRLYEQMTEQATTQILALGEFGPIVHPVDDSGIEWRGDSVSWSGLVVVPREGFENVGGYDERWRFWGGDDVAFACAMNTLWGKVTRLEGAAIHLWHPRDALDAQPQEQHDLMYRYLAADGDPEAMRALIAERQVTA